MTRMTLKKASERSLFVKHSRAFAAVRVFMTRMTLKKASERSLFVKHSRAFAAALQMTVKILTDSHHLHRGLTDISTFYLTKLVVMVIFS